MDQYATTEELLEAVFSMRSVQMLCSEDQREKLVGCRSRRLAVLSYIIVAATKQRSVEK
jgi:hypothetical protein